MISLGKIRVGLSFLITNFFESGLFHEEKFLSQPLIGLPERLETTINKFIVFQTVLVFSIILFRQFLFHNSDFFLIEGRLIEYFINNPQGSFQIEDSIIIIVLIFHNFDSFHQQFYFLLFKFQLILVFTNIPQQVNLFTGTSFSKSSLL